MKDIYNLLTVEDVHKDEKTIMDVLQGIYDGRLKNDIRILNYYREIPVSYPAEISSIEDDMVEMQVNQQQAVVMYVENMAFLKSAHFQHDVVAKVFKAKISKSLAFLHNFSYAQVRAERRQNVRVQISDLLNVNFRRVDQNFSGRLADISIGGLSIDIVDPITIQTETAGILTVDLPGGSIEMPGRLLKIIPQDPGMRYIFEIEAGQRIESTISQFIFQKQVEIIRELKDHLVQG